LEACNSVYPRLNPPYRCRLRPDSAHLRREPGRARILGPCGSDGAGRVDALDVPDTGFGLRAGLLRLGPLRPKRLGGAHAASWPTRTAGHRLLGGRLAGVRGRSVRHTSGPCRASR